MKGEPAVFLGQSEGISGWIVMMDKDGSITHSRDIRMTPHALSPTPPHREAGERSPPRLPIVELGPTSSDADDELGRETATEGQPVAGGAGETGDPPATQNRPQRSRRQLLEFELKTAGRWCQWSSPIPSHLRDPPPVAADRYDIARG